MEKQLTIFDLLSVEERTEPLLKVGDIVYKTTLDQYTKYEVTSVYECARGFGYHLQKSIFRGAREFKSYQTTWCDEIGKVAFKKEKEAVEHCNKLTQKLNRIDVSKNEIIDQFVGSYIRDVDGRKINFFAAIIENNRVLFKGPIMYTFLKEFNSLNECKTELKKFVKEYSEENDKDVENQDVRNMVTPMYFVKEGLYAEADYAERHGKPFI